MYSQALKKRDILKGKQLQLSTYEDTVKITEKLVVAPAYKIRTVPTLNIDTVEITRILLVQDDSLGAAQKLREKFPTKKIVVLNFANNDSFCDRKFSGLTQEEDLARRTNLYHSLADLPPLSDIYELSDISERRDGALYPISSRDGTGPEFLISRDITVVKDASGNRLAMPFKVDILSAAAIVNPRQVHLAIIHSPTLVGGDEEDDVDNMTYDYANKRDVDLMRQKVKNIIEYVLSIRTDILITGAWGMGAFNNPEYGLIQIWNQELKKFLKPSFGQVQKKESDTSAHEQKTTQKTKAKSSLVVVFAIASPSHQDEKNEQKNDSYTMKCFKKFLQRV